MSAALPWILLGALAAHAGAHVTVAVRLALAGERDRAALAFFLPPLLPLWGWRAGMRASVAVWTGALVVYALGVALA